MKTRYFDHCESLDEAKKEYKRLALKLHPDRGGDTAAFQEMQNQFENFRPASGKQKYKTEFDDWAPRDFMNIIEALMKIPGLTFDVVGSWIWITGDTRPVKDQIKEIDTGETYKRGWSKTKTKWYFSPKGYRKRSKKDLSYDQITAFYGSQSFKGQKEEDKPKRKKLTK